MDFSEEEIIAAIEICKAQLEDNPSLDLTIQRNQFPKDIELYIRRGGFYGKVRAYERFGLMVYARAIDLLFTQNDFGRNRTSDLKKEGEKIMSKYDPIIDVLTYTPNLERFMKILLRTNPDNTSKSLPFSVTMLLVVIREYHRFNRS